MSLIPGPTLIDSTPQTQPLLQADTKVAIVTGAASGIGLAIAKKLLQEGAKVMMVDRDESLGRYRASTLNEEYPNCASFSAADVTNYQQLSDTYVRTKEVFGGLDIVCNNAGIIHGEHNWKKMFEVNVFGVIDGVQLAIDHMSTAKGGKGGVIINMASGLGLINAPMGMAKYAASKGALVQYTRAMASLSSTDGIRINCICPYAVDTPATHSAVLIGSTTTEFPQEVVQSLQNTAMSPEQVAEGVYELISDSSKSGAVMTMYKTSKDGQPVTEYPKLLEHSWGN